MIADHRRSQFAIWAFAFGYFVFYTPYSATVKSVSKGLWPGFSGPFSRIEILPGAFLGTAVVVLLFVTVLGWWRYVPTRKVLGIPVPCPHPLAALSGLGTAVIIATTTLAYTFHGISIVFALLLMRGGVLIMAPIVDAVFRRRVEFNSWLGLALSLTALSLLLADQDGNSLSLAAVVNLAAYYLGYAIRLQCITATVKSKQPAARHGYFAEEQMISMPLLLLAGAALTWYGTNSADLSTGLVPTVFANRFAPPMLLIGVLYGGLFLFGSLIYMDARENSFCVPVNRCSSVLAGVVASFVLVYLFDQQPVGGMQLLGAAVIGAAILALALPSLAIWPGREAVIARGARNLLLFVCDGNTSRSPMAQAICRSEIAKRLGVVTLEGEAPWLSVLSAGLSAESGRPISRKALLALHQVEVPATDHTARNLTADLVNQAEVIYCMTGRQRADLIAKFPRAVSKTFCLDPSGDIDNPSGASLDGFVSCARQIRLALARRLEELDPLLARMARPDFQRSVA